MTSKSMDPDRFQMKDLKRRQATAERHIERLKGQVRLLKDRLKGIQSQLDEWGEPPPARRK